MKKLYAGVQVRIPKTPNFLKLEGTDTTISIGSLSDDELKILGDMWTESLIDKARIKRKERKIDETRD